MTLEEAILHAEEVAYEQDMKAGFETDNQTYTISEEERERCKECAKEHRQLAEWLKELKKLRKFAHYVAYSITAEEEEFNENPRFFGESYCRKLHKLGIIKMVDNKWVYDEEVNADAPD